MIGIQFDSGDTAEAVQMQAFDRGLLVLEAGDDCVRMSPPLVVDEAEAATAVRDLHRGRRARRAPRAADVAEVARRGRAGSRAAAAARPDGAGR